MIPVERHLNGSFTCFLPLNGVVTAYNNLFLNKIAQAVFGNVMLFQNLLCNQKR